MVLAESGAKGLVITAVNVRAARAGLHPGLSLADARAAVPSLVSHPAETARDARALHRLALWLGRYGPARNVDGADGVWIDITGVAHLFGGEERLMEDLVRRLAAFTVTARAGLADTPGAAHALGRFATRQRAIAIAPAGETGHALSDLPVDALQLTPETVLLLKRLGLGTIGHLTGLPRASLERRFASSASARGKAAGAAKLAGAVLVRLDQALGRSAEPRQPLGEPPVLSVRRTWSEPLVSSEALMGEIGELAGDLAAALTAAGLGARRVALHLYRADGTVAHAEAGLSQASADAAHMMQLLEQKLGNLDAGFGIDVASLDASQAEPLAARQVALDAGGDAAAGTAIAALVDRLTNRLGAAHVFRIAARASHIPERSAVRMPPHAAATDTGTGTPESRSRPLFLLSPPERISVMAEVPDGPPLRFTWRRVLYPVTKAAGPERIAPEWWRHLAPPEAARCTGARR